MHEKRARYFSIKKAESTAKGGGGRETDKTLAHTRQAEV